MNKSQCQADPFIKWAGGKRSLIPYITPLFPDKVKTYYEPFVGGGAVFFTFSNRIEKAYLSDMNEELIITYKMVKNRVEDLIKILAEHKRGHESESYFKEVRAYQPTDPLEIAARFIYLNKTCYNGLYRVNKQGLFNVPKGSYKNPDICNSGRLREASKVLAKATIQLGDFELNVKPNSNDFIYCDPPYDDCFTQYQANGFTESDQKRLRNAIITWSQKGANILLSNSDTPLIRHLYKNKHNFKIKRAKAPRFINSNAKGRSPVSEILVST